MKLTTIIIITTLAVVLTACGEPDPLGSGSSTTVPPATTTTTTITTTTTVPPTTQPPIVYDRGADAVVLEIHMAPGFTTREWAARSIPTAVLFGDGRLVVAAPVPEIFPGPAVLPMHVYELTEDQMQTVLRAALDAGLSGEDQHYPFDMIADASTAVFTISVDGDTHTTSVYALGIGHGGLADDSGLSADDLAARAALGELQQQVLDSERWLGLDSPAPYQPVAYLVHRAVGPPPDQGLAQPVIDWPLADAEFDGTRFGMPCLAVIGSDANALGEVLGEANELTQWQLAEDNVAWLVFRPSFPGEPGCE